MKHYFEHFTQVVNKPISSLFVFSVVCCVVFRQKLKKTRHRINIKTFNERKHKNENKKHINETDKLREETLEIAKEKQKYMISSPGPDRE